MFAYLFTSEVVVVLTLFTAYLAEQAVGMFNAQIVRADKTPVNPGSSFCRWRN